MHPDLVAVALSTRPMPAADTTWRRIDRGIVVWGDKSPPARLGDVGGAVWPFLDGRTPVNELAEDVATVSQHDLSMAREHLATFVTDLTLAGLLDGTEPIVKTLQRLYAPADPAEVPDGEPVYYKVDGVEYVSLTVEITNSDLDQVLDERQSPAELIPADSCMGQKMRLGVEGTLTHLLLDGERVSIRTNGPAIAGMISELAPAAEEKGPVGAFVASIGADRGVSVHRIYDGNAVLSAVTTDPQEAARLAIVVAGGRHPTVRDTYPFALRALVRGDEAILVPSGFVDHAPGLIRRLRRARWYATPMSRLSISEDASTIQVPGGDDGPIPPVTTVDGQRLWGSFRLLGSVVVGNKQAEYDRSHMVTLLARETAATTAQERARLLERLDTAIADRPHVPVFAVDRSAGRIVARIVNTFG